MSICHHPNCRRSDLGANCLGEGHIPFRLRLRKCAFRASSSSPAFSYVAPGSSRSSLVRQPASRSAHLGTPIRNLQSLAARSSSDDSSLTTLKAFASTSIFRIWIQGAVFVIVLAAVDAAFSGDWSRIGVISTDTEATLKPLVVALGLFHVGCAVVAARSAQEKNLNVPLAVLKVLAVGFLAMVEVLLADPEQQKG